ncbi:MAG: hypothetical protein H0W89_07600, partial [Candidatus Levybacteria bacterium]|nr:hypothetical protein [Candidatus Levybacteria bacterium]
MLGEKGRIIDQQTAQLAEKDAELAKLRPFAGPAEQMLTEHTRLSTLAATDPASLPTDLYSAAVESVRATYHADVVQAAAAAIRAQRGDEIRAEVLGQEGPQ